MDTAKGSLAGRGSKVHYTTTISRHHPVRNLCKV